MARRSTQPRELVRLTPLQFSLSVSVVVLLVAGAGLAGYIYGQKEARKVLHAAKPLPSPGQDAGPASMGSVAGSQTPVTFYSTLTEPREPPPPVQRPVPAPAPKPEPTPTAAATATPTATAPLILQIASYAREDAAARLLADLSQQGYKGSVVRADLGERGIWYRVRVGPYADEKDARRALEKLREERNLKGYIVK